MAFKINVAHKGKTFKFETNDEALVGVSIGDSLLAGEYNPDLAEYELEITGTSDKAGFAGFNEVEGPGLKRLLLGYGKGMHKKPKGEKKVNRRPKGLKLRKMVRGKEVSLETVQINTKVKKEGTKKFATLFETPTSEEKKE